MLMAAGFQFRANQDWELPFKYGSPLMPARCLLESHDLSEMIDFLPSTISLSRVRAHPAPPNPHFVWAAGLSYVVT